MNDFRIPSASEARQLLEGTSVPSLEEMKAGAPVKAWFTLLASAISQEDQRRSKADMKRGIRPNIYAGAIMLGAAQDVERAMSGMLDKSDKASLQTLKAKVTAAFNPFRALTAWQKKLDAAIATAPLTESLNEDALECEACKHKWDVSGSQKPNTKCPKCGSDRVYTDVFRSSWHEATNEGKGSREERTYDDPSAAQEYTQKLKMKGMGNIRQDKKDGKWVVSWTDLAKNEAAPKLSPEEERKWMKIYKDAKMGSPEAKKAREMLLGKPGPWQASKAPMPGMKVNRESVNEGKGNWKALAQKLLDKDAGAPSQEGLGYRGYLRAVVAGQGTAQWFKLPGGQGRGAALARQALIDLGGTEFKEAQVDQKPQTKSGDEYDLSKGHRSKRAGHSAGIKKGMNKRKRSDDKLALKRGEYDEDVSEAEGKASKSVQFKCEECEKKFRKMLTKNTIEVKCPGCGGYDTLPTDYFGEKLGEAVPHGFQGNDIAIARGIIGTEGGAIDYETHLAASSKGVSGFVFKLTSGDPQKIAAALAKRFGSKYKFHVTPGKQEVKVVESVDEANPPRNRKDLAATEKEALRYANADKAKVHIVKLPKNGEYTILRDIQLKHVRDSGGQLVKTIRPGQYKTEDCWDVLRRECNEIIDNETK